MTTEDIQQATDVKILETRLKSKDLRKKERRLIWRKIGRLIVKAKEEEKNEK